MPSPDYRRRVPSSLLVASLAVLGLAGCERPTPQVTVFSGTESRQVQSMCWNAEGEQTSEQDCQVRKERVGTIDVAAGQTVGISVDLDLAEDGWVPTIGQQRLVAEPLTSPYYRFQLGERDLSSGPLEMRIYAVAGPGGERTRGLWVFRLQRS